jgi:regulatory protein
MEGPEKAFAYAVKLLAWRDRSICELERKLLDRGFPAEVGADVVARLKKSGYLDDRRFAERWAESAVTNGRGYGPRLSHELLRRGIPREIVAEVIAGIAESYDEQKTLSALVARKFAGFDPKSASDRDKKRVVDFLQRRGFSTAAIFRVFNSWADCQGDRRLSDLA